MSRKLGKKHPQYVGVYTKFKEAFASSTASVTEVFYNPT